MASENTVRFETNKPVICALKFTDGLAVSSKFSGDQVMFTLIDDRRMYVAPAVAQKIAAAGVQPGEFFTIEKREITQGNRRTINYVVETGASASLASTPVPASSPIGSNGLSRSTPSYAAPAPAVLAGPPCGAAAPETRPASVADSSAIALMKTAGLGAIDAVLEIERYAQQRGLTDFAFGADNIQKLAACLFIELSKKAGRA